MEFLWISRSIQGFTYSDLLKMPVFERKFFINKLIDEQEKKK